MQAAILLMLLGGLMTAEAATAAPRIEITGQTSEFLMFAVDGPVGQNFVGEFSYDLKRWHPLYSFTLGPSRYTNAIGRLAAPRMYLRVVEDLPHAPAEISGRTVGGRMTEGAGFFANAVTFTWEFRTNTDYGFLGGNSFANHSGTYTYRKLSEAQATLTFQCRPDFFEPAGTATLNFTSRTGGTIEIQETGIPGPPQTGRFTLGFYYNPLGF